MSTDRSWIKRRVVNGSITHEFEQGVAEFLNFAYSHEECVTADGKIKCPCNKCQLTNFGFRVDVKFHLVKFGFSLDYTIWDQHGEKVSVQNAPNRNSTPIEIQIEEGVTKGKNVVDVHCKTRRKRGSDTTTPIVKARVEANPANLTPSDTQARVSRPPFNLEAWITATGGVKKGRVAGFGSTTVKELFAIYGTGVPTPLSKPACMTSTTSSSKPACTTSLVMPEAMEQRFMQLQTEVQTRLGSMEARLESLQNQVGSLVDVLSTQFCGDSSTSNPLQ